MGDAVVIKSRTRGEWAVAVLGFFAAGSFVGVCVGVVIVAFTSGIANIGADGPDVPALPTIGVLACAVGGLCASVAGWLLRPRDLSVVGGAGAGGTEGLGRVQRWGSGDAAHGATDGDGRSDSAAVTGG